MRRLGVVALLALTLSGDTMFTVALIWTALSVRGATLPLGITLAVMSALPYAVQLALPQLKAWIARHPTRAFGAARTVGLAVAIAGLVAPGPLPQLALYAAAGVFTAAVFVCQQALETTMSGLVLRRALTARRASRLLQTAIQLGAFAGGAIGGLIVERAGLRWTFAALIATLLAGLLVPAALGRAAGPPIERAGATPATPATAASSPRTGPALPAGARSAVLWMSLIAVGVLTVQLGAFNYLIPILLKQVKLWSAADYGLVSAAAGVGALAATLVGLGRGERLGLAVAAALIAAIDAGLWATGSPALAIAAAGVLGFAFNTLRIRQRELMYDAVTDAGEAAEWAGRATVVLQVTKALVPLALAVVIDHVGPGRAGPLFASIGTSVAAVLVLLHIHQLRCLAGPAPGGALPVRGDS